MFFRHNSKTLIRYTTTGALLGVTSIFSHGFGYNDGIITGINYAYKTPYLGYDPNPFVNFNLKTGLNIAVAGAIAGACLGGTIAMGKIAATSSCRFFNNMRQQVNEHKKINILESNHSNKI